MGGGAWDPQTFLGKPDINLNRINYKFKLKSDLISMKNKDQHFIDEKID